MKEAYSWSCSFEDASGAATWCDTTQASNDQFDWTMGQGSTPSSPTGPDAAQSGQHYVFIEATRRQKHDTAA